MTRSLSQAPRRHRLAAALGLCGLALATMASPGCDVPGPRGRADTFGLNFSLPPSSNVRGAIVFCVDGVSASVFQQMLDAGELPAFRKYFVDRGLYAPHAVANIPSVTLPNFTSIVTGVFPGHHGITGLNWFDRNRLIWRDYETIAQKNTLDNDYRARTIYEMLPDRTTASIFLQPHRGATRWIEDWMSAGPPYALGWYAFVDRLTLWRWNCVLQLARRRHELPAVTFCYLIDTDFAAYDYGASSPEYRQALRHTDRQIGRVLGDVQRAGLLDKITIALVSDHGMVDVTHHCDVEKLLRYRVGLDVATEHLWESTPFDRRLDYYQQHAVVCTGSGDRYYALYLRRLRRGPDGRVEGLEPWPKRPTEADLEAYPVQVPPRPPGLAALLAPAPHPSHVNLLTRLLAVPAVDTIAYSPAPGVVRVRRRSGEVEFRGRGSITCRILAGDDPLGWKGHVPADVLAGQRAGSPRQWLQWTASTNFPDLAPQIVAYFQSPKAGDIALFAAPAWDFNTVHHGGHGGLSPGDMFVPMLLAGPGVPHARLKLACTVDLVPTLLTLLGRTVPPGLDGQSLVAPPPKNQARPDSH